jgi:hypothetical protein
LLSDSRLVTNPVILEPFSLPWEEDILTSPSSKDWEAPSSVVADIVIAPVSEETSVKAACGSS